MPRMGIALDGRVAPLRRHVQFGGRLIAVGVAPLCVTVLAPQDAQAFNGPFLHGDGISAQGFGGIGIVAAADSYALAANPANAATLTPRFDLGINWEQVFSHSEFRGNLLGPDQGFSSRFRDVIVPQGGVTTRLSDSLSVGVAGFAAGFGTDYKQSPLQRFGGDERAGITVMQAGLTHVLAWQPQDAQAFGIALNLSYQLAEVEGVAPLKVLSADPQHVTDQGADGAFGIGFSLGWHAYLTPWLEAGVAYRSKTWAERFKDYAGLLPDHGRLELPARYGAAVALRPWSDWTFAVEVQRALFAEEAATGNRLAQLYEGERLGDDEGPGFGWRNQTVVKFGVAWQVTPSLDLRAGYSHGTQVVRTSETLISMLAPAPIQEHYTLGVGYESRSGWLLNSYIGYAPRVWVYGEDSIPLLLGGGEANVRNGSHMIGVSVGRALD